MGGSKKWSCKLPSEGCISGDDRPESADLPVQMYINAGGSLTDPTPFGCDPICGCPSKID